MTFIDEVSALTHAGSLLSEDGQICAPYDLEVSGTFAKRYRALLAAPEIKNANAEPFEINYGDFARVHVINGMGVTLGDSIIGLTALSAIRKRHPAVSFTIYRPRRAPEYVRQLYRLAEPLFGTVVDLPVHIDQVPATELRVDVGNHLFWSGFATMPMVDFFLWALGVSPQSVNPEDKSNEWLKLLPLPNVSHDRIPRDYVLLCPTASTRVRSIPPSLCPELVERLWTKFGLPVLGFGGVDHPRYTDITDRSPDTASFLAWIKSARFLLTSDSAAVHIAAGFYVPTLAFFTTIAAQMRVRDYRACMAIDLPVPDLAGIQASGRERDLAIIERAFSAFMGTNWTL